jgi:hypothetical protein
MNEFEQYLASNFGLKPGDDVPDDIYDQASAGFLQSRTTVPTIAPNASSFDLDRAIPNASPAAPVAQPNQKDPDALQGTPFDYGRAVPILEQFASDYVDKENLVRGAKYGDKADIESDWMNAREMTYGPVLQELGVTPAKAQIAAISVERGKAKNMLEALGIPERQAPGQQSLSLEPEKVEQARILQQARDAELQMADAPNVDEVTVANSRQRAASLDEQINDLLGVKDLPWADRWNQNRIAKLDAARMEEMKGGSVNYLGVPTSFENLPALRTQIGRDEINLKMEAEKNPDVLLINRKNTAVVEQDLTTGKSVLSEAKSKEKWAGMEKQLFEEGKLRVGDLIQNPITGAVEVFPGLGKAETGKDKSLVERWSPGGMGKPVIRGAQEVGDQVTEVVRPVLTDENVDKAAAVADRFYPRGFVGPTLRGSAALVNDPARAVAPVASGVFTSLPLGFLASRGLDYLTNIGRKAEEEEKKRQAGQ